MDTYISKKSDVQILPWHNDIGLKNEDEKNKKKFFCKLHKLLLEKKNEIFC